jgi:HYR domain
MRKSFGVAAVMLAATAVPVAGGDADGSSGTLNLRGQVLFVSVIASCPPGGEPGWICHLNTGTAVIAGLGRVSETYFHIAVTEPCPPFQAKMLATSVRLSVAGKGDLNLAMAGFPECLPVEYVPGASPLAFTVTGGTGVYVGASGSGIATRTATPPSGRVTGSDTWTGTLVVPGLEFDLTAPTISGARAKVVRAPRNAKQVRVRYRVTATDNVDGSVVVACQPRSGSRFKVGRTIVRCFADDRSGNTATARFTVTVRRNR